MQKPREDGSFQAEHGRGVPRGTVDPQVENPEGSGRQSAGTLKWELEAALSQSLGEQMMPQRGKEREKPYPCFILLAGCGE